jgi:thiol-disulfide isomerase/thioredoxin
MKTPNLFSMSLIRQIKISLKQVCFSLMITLLFNQTVLGVELGHESPGCRIEIQAHPGTFTPETYKGKVVLLDFWATWCAPCIKSMPFFSKLYQRYQKDGFEILAINVDENREDAVSFMKSRPISYPVVYSPDEDCPKTFAVTAMPSSYFIDKSGKVRQILRGYRDEDQPEIQQLLERLLKE